MAKRTRYGAFQMAWMILILAGLCEVAWAIGLKLYGFKFTWGGAWTFGMMLLSFYLNALAMKSLPLGTAYAVWTGIGAVETTIYGIVRLNEPGDWPRVACIFLIVAGIIGLKVI